MEPMALGSAPSSPTSSANSSFLPAFLMGQHEGSTLKPVMSSSSPLLNRNQTYSLSTTEEASPIIKQRLFGPVAPELPTEPTPTNSNKPGPPKQGLFDTIDITKSNSPYTSNYEDSTVNFNTSYSLNNTPQLSRDENLSNWVTVFGFTGNLVNTVLFMLSKCGTIVDKRIPSQGNWINVKFSSKTEATKALALNGTLLSDKTMVGVKPYHEKRDKENIDISRNIYSSPVRVRSLKHSFVSPQGSDTVIPTQNVPQKSTGIVTKAMEYVFGW